MRLPLSGLVDRARFVLRANAAPPDASPVPAPLPLKRSRPFPPEHKRLGGELSWKVVICWQCRTLRWIRWDALGAGRAGMPPSLLAIAPTGRSDQTRPDQIRPGGLCTFDAVLRPILVVNQDQALLLAAASSSAAHTPRPGRCLTNKAGKPSTCQD